MDKSTHNNSLNSIFLFQGAYFIITGIWPVLNMDSFLIATGPKQDTWLVQMVGLLAASIGITFLVAALRRKRLPILLAYLASSSFLISDIIYVANETIQRIYLLDAGIQLAFLSGLTFFTIKSSKQK